MRMVELSKDMQLSQLHYKIGTTMLAMISSDWQRQIFEKKIWRLELGPNGPNQAQNDVFRHFLESGSLVFLKLNMMIAATVPNI